MNEWPRDDSTPVSTLIDRLRPYYAWTDKLAVIYGNTYRSAFIVCYLLASLAVALAMGPVAFGLIGGHHHGLESVFAISECVVIAWILVTVGIARWRHWHERWIDYRLTGELIRHLRLVLPLGGGRSLPRMPAHLSAYGHPASTWMAWYVRAVERELGLPSVRMNRAHIKECLAQVKSLLKGQITYHQVNSRRCHRIESRLHKAGIWLLFMTLGACLIHAVAGAALPLWVGLMLISFCGFFPALGAALAGINNQGEFRRIAKRSEAMGQQLPNLSREADRLEEKLFTNDDKEETLLSMQVAALASRAASLMVYEVLDWRVVFLDRPLRPPA